MTTKVIIEIEYDEETDTVSAKSNVTNGEYDPSVPVCYVADKILSLWQDHVNKVTGAFASEGNV